jgi:uncharacterized protein YeaO (DUF488 family)
MTTAAGRVRAKRVYDPPSRLDGRRILVDGLWPRGVDRRTARIDEWARDLAPSTRLRRWFGHDPARWPEFQTRYRAELRTRWDRLEWLADLARRGQLTLVYAARDSDHNNARALRRLVADRLRRRVARGGATTR